MMLMLLRHGKPGYGHPLAKEGFRQAEFIAAQFGKGKLAVHTPIVILTSPASRAAATAKVIAQVLNVPIMIKEALGIGGGKEQTILADQWEPGRHGRVTA